LLFNEFYCAKSNFVESLVKFEEREVRGTELEERSRKRDISDFLLKRWIQPELKLT